MKLSGKSGNCLDNQETVWTIWLASLSHSLRPKNLLKMEKSSKPGLQICAICATTLPAENKEANLLVLRPSISLLAAYMDT